MDWPNDDSPFAPDRGYKSLKLLNHGMRPSFVSVAMATCAFQNAVHAWHGKIEVYNLFSWR